MFEIIPCQEGGAEQGQKDVGERDTEHGVSSPGGVQLQRTIGGRVEHMTIQITHRCGKLQTEIRLLQRPRADVLASGLRVVSLLSADPFIFEGQKTVCFCLTEMLKVLGGDQQRQCCMDTWVCCLHQSLESRRSRLPFSYALKACWNIPLCFR